MFCENCGEKVSKDDAFCTNCGSPIKKEESSNVTEDVKKEVTEQVTTEESSNVSDTQVKEKTPEPATPVESVVSNNIQGENIKKGSTGKVILIILTILIVLAAVGAALYFFVFKNKNEQSVDALDKAVENMKDLKNYTMVITGDIATKGDESFDASFNWETNVDVENKKAKMNVNVSSSEIEMELPAYIDFSNQKSGMVYFKLPEALSGVDEWTKVSLGEVNFDELIDSSIQNDDNDYEKELEEFKEKIKDIDFVKKEKSDISGCDYYEIVINEENIKKLREVYEDFDLTDADIEDMQLEDGLVIGVYINKKENYISKIKLDMADYINKFADEEVTFEKLVMSIEYKDINKVSEITIPTEAKNAEELDLNEIAGNYLPGGNDIPDNNVQDTDTDIPDNNVQDTDTDEYVEDYTIKDYGFTVKYKMPSGFEPSSVNSSDFKIYRNDDDLRVVISNYWGTKEERFEEIELDKEYYEKEDGYKNVTLSDEKTLKFNDKEFTYKELSYENSYSKYYETTVCYQLDDEHVYRVEYEKSGSPITENELKLFLDITVSKD